MTSTLFQRIRQNFPIELQDLDQWVAWKFEQRPDRDKPTKVLYNPATNTRADSTKPETWATFEDAGAAYARGGYDGVGFVVTEDDPYCGIDLDNCIVDGEFTENALRWVEQLDSYTEVTPSRKGVRVWVRGVKPGDRCKHSKLGVEIYQSDRFFTVTGQRLDALPAKVMNRQKQLTALYNELFPVEQTPPTQHRSASAAEIPQDDVELLNRMFAARNGSAIRSLWNGDTSAHDGDESSADQALCNHLSFWTGCDAQRMDRLFRRSGLMRPKWDRRARQGETYGQGTIARAIAATHTTYDPKHRRDDDDRGSGASAPKIDPIATINQARKWIKSHSFLPYIDPERLPADGLLRREDVLRRVADAVLDILEERHALSGFLSLRDLRRRAGVGVESVRRAMARLMPWFVALTDHEQNAQEKAAFHYILSFRDNETVCPPRRGEDTICLAIAKTPFSAHKAHDAFNVGGNRDMRNAALRIVIGRPAVDALVQLEGYDQPRRQAWSEYRLAEREMEAKGAAVTPEDVETLMRLADGLIADPEPVTLDALAHLANCQEGIRVLADLGAVDARGAAVCLCPDYAPVINAQVASLGPVALLIIDCLLEHGDMSLEELALRTGFKYGSLQRAMHKLVKREVCEGERAGLTKRFSVSADWLPTAEAQLPTMRTNGLYQKREIADATAVYTYCGEVMEVAAPDQRPTFERRRERAFSRLMAAVALEAPTLATDTNFTVSMRLWLDGKRRAQAPTMDEPGALAWQRFFVLTGKGPLATTEAAELHDLAKTLGQEVAIPWAGEVAPDRRYVPTARDEQQYPLTRLAEFAEMMAARHGESWNFRLHPATVGARFAEFAAGRTAVRGMS